MGIWGFYGFFYPVRLSALDTQAAAAAETAGILPDEPHDEATTSSGSKSSTESESDSPCRPPADVALHTESETVTISDVSMLRGSHLTESCSSEEQLYSALANVPYTEGAKVDGFGFRLSRKTLRSPTPFLVVHDLQRAGDFLFSSGLDGLAAEVYFSITSYLIEIHADSLLLARSVYDCSRSAVTQMQRLVALKWSALTIQWLGDDTSSLKELLQYYACQPLNTAGSPTLRSSAVRFPCSIGSLSCEDERYNETLVSGSDIVLCACRKSQPSLTAFRSWLGEIHWAIDAGVHDLCMILLIMRPHLSVDYTGSLQPRRSSSILKHSLTSDEVATCIFCFLMTRQDASNTAFKNNCAACLRLSVGLATISKDRRGVSTLANAFDLLARSRSNSYGGSACAEKLLEACCYDADPAHGHRCFQSNELFRRYVALKIHGLSPGAVTMKTGIEDAAWLATVSQPLMIFNLLDDAFASVEPSTFLDLIQEEGAMTTPSTLGVWSAPVASVTEPDTEPFSIDTLLGPMLSDTASVSSSTKSIWMYAMSLAAKQSRWTSRESDKSFDGMSLELSNVFSEVDIMISKPSLLFRFPSLRREQKTWSELRAAMTRMETET